MKPSKKWFDVVNKQPNDFIVDNIHIIDRTDTFKALLIQDKDIIVPLLYKPNKYFTNIWYNLNSNGYYENCNIKRYSYNIPKYEDQQIIC